MRFTVSILLFVCLMAGHLLPARSYTLQFNAAATVQQRWPTTTITFALSTSLTNPPGNIKAGSDVAGAARRALARWSEASSLRFVVTTSDRTAFGQDGVSLITAAQENAPSFNSPDQPGRARVVFNPANGEIQEADVALNPNTQFSTDGTPGTYDLESTLVHEIGHALGLEHSGLVSASMQPRQGRNGTFGLPAQTVRTLSDDDRAGIRAVYGPRSGLGSVAGVVRGPSGALFGAHVWVEDAATGRAVAGNITLPNGSYRIDSLPPAQYRVRVEALDEPVLSTEIPSRSGAYQGLQQSRPAPRTVEVTDALAVAADATSALDISLDGSQSILNPRFVGVGGQLTTIPAPLVPGQTVTLLVGGNNLHTVAANNIRITSGFFTVNPATVQQFVFTVLPTGEEVQVLSFDVTASILTPPGEYSLRLVSNSGEVAYLSSGITVDLPAGTTASTPNPIDDPQFFVAQQYRDFLNREPDAAGLQFWTNQIAECGGNAQCVQNRRVNVSAAFFLSREFQETGFFVYRAYRAAFNRFPRFNEFLPDTQTIGRGVVIGQPGAEERLEANTQAFAGDFVNRPAFLAQYPATLSPEQFVDALNANTGFSLSQAERDALVAGLRAGTATRATVLRRVIEDDDFERREFNSAFVLEQYFGYLRRNPDDPPDTDFSGFNFWLSKLNQFNGNFVAAEMVKAFIISSEYRGRFGRP